MAKVLPLDTTTVVVLEPQHGVYKRSEKLNAVRVRSKDELNNFQVPTDLGAEDSC